MTEISAEPVTRVSSTFADMDWVYGPSLDPGAPKGRISLWSGAPGVGKSRLIAEIMKRLALAGRDSVLFQGETPAANFKEEKFAGVDSPHIYLSEADTIDMICEQLSSRSFAWAFIDSYQMIRCVRAAAKKIGKKPIEYTIDRLREVIVETGTHLVLISQLNKEGKTKGSNDLPHLVDIECYLRRFGEDVFGDQTMMFEFTIAKNRYGLTGRHAVYEHHSWGVNEGSSHHMKDSVYMGSLADNVHVSSAVDDVVVSEASEVVGDRRTLMEKIIGWKKPY